MAKAVASYERIGNEWFANGVAIDTDRLESLLGDGITGYTGFQGCINAQSVFHPEDPGEVDLDMWMGYGVDWPRSAMSYNKSAFPRTQSSYGTSDAATRQAAQEIQFDLNTAGAGAAYQSDTDFATVTLTTANPNYDAFAVEGYCNIFIGAASFGTLKHKQDGDATNAFIIRSAADNSNVNAGSHPLGMLGQDMNLATARWQGWRTVWFALPLYNNQLKLRYGSALTFGAGSAMTLKIIRAWL